jgi:hypothetical protein
MKKSLHNGFSPKYFLKVFRKQFNFSAQMILTNWVRVTRLGEFWLIGWLFTLGSFFENYRSRPHSWATFCHGQGLRNNIDIKWIGQNSRRRFHKLIWSPCFSNNYLAQRKANCLRLIAFFKKCLRNDKSLRSLKRPFSFSTALH